MKIRTLENFIAIATEGSISRAARKMNITQSALSQQIMNLEHEMGAELLLRTPNGVRLSSSGEILLQHANDMLSHYAEAKSDIQTNQTHIRGEVSLAMSSSMADEILPELLRHLHENLPQVTLQLIEASSLRTYSLLEDAKVDLGIIPEIARADLTFDCVTVARTQLRLIGLVEAGFQSEPDDADISLAEALRYPLAVMSKHPSVKELIQKAAEDKGLEAEFLFESTSARIVRSYVISALACTIMPGMLLFSDQPKGRFFSRRIVDPVIERSYAIASPNARRLNRQGQAVKAALEAILSKALSDY